MGNKISHALKKCKPVFIIVLILWIILSIVFVAPVNVSWVDATINGEGNFIENLLNNYGDIWGNFVKSFKSDYIGNFFKLDLFLIIALMFFGIVGVVKTLPKHDYTDIEHGSSDWANGDQYSILSKNKGILLAEKHYLPVDKRGNVNVLVVGRFRIW